MLIPNLVSLLASIAVLYIVFRRSIPNEYSLEAVDNPKLAIRDTRLFLLSWYVIVILLVGF